MYDGKRRFWKITRQDVLVSSCPDHTRDRAGRAVPNNLRSGKGSAGTPLASRRTRVAEKVPGPGADRPHTVGVVHREGEGPVSDRWVEMYLIGSRLIAGQEREPLPGHLSGLSRCGASVGRPELAFGTRDKVRPVK
jgi:hypothetical protein